MSPHTALMREHSLSLFHAGIAAADPYAAVSRCLRANGDTLYLGRAGEAIRDGRWPRIHVIAIGKAACRMAASARDAIPGARFATPGLIVTTRDNAIDVDGYVTLGAGHPLPDADGWRAANRVIERLASVQAGELVLALISGGGSALLPCPVDDVSLDEKIAVTRLLLSHGATIDEINCVRKHLSKLKGGGLARLIEGADLHALLLSDVLGDDPSAIASGPTVADTTTFTDAIAILNRRDIWPELPASVQTYLTQGACGAKPETLKPDAHLLQRVSYTLIGSNALSLDAVNKAAAKLGYRTHLFSRQLTGEARHAGQRLAEHCKSLVDGGARSAVAVIAGGETTVTLIGAGKGGRNQELALAFALTAERIGLDGEWTFLSGGSDGIDGPTDAAGGLIDNRTLTRLRAAGMDPLQSLTDNDSYPALASAGDLLMTGSTGTNVADLQIALLSPRQE